MTLDKISLDLTYKILANVQIKDYSKHAANVKSILLASLTSVYTKARHEEFAKEPWDISTHIFNDVTTP